MPTEPIKELLPDLDSNIALKDYLINISNIAFEVVNYGTVILKQYIDNKLINDYNIASVVLYRHGLELLYSIALNVKYSCIDPSKIIVRSLFENLINLKYLYKDNFELRSLAFFYCQILHELKWLQKGVPGTQAYKQFQSIIKNDEYIKELPFPELSVINQRIFDINNGLSENHFSILIQEKEKLKRKGNSNPAWYHFFSGPKTIELLAKEVDCYLLYEILYRSYSSKVHSSEVLKGNFSINGLTQ